MRNPQDAVFDLNSMFLASSSKLPNNFDVCKGEIKHEGKDEETTLVQNLRKDMSATVKRVFIRQLLKPIQEAVENLRRQPLYTSVIICGDFAEALPKWLKEEVVADLTMIGLESEYFGQFIGIGSTIQSVKLNQTGQRALIVEMQDTMMILSVEELVDL